MILPSKAVVADLQIAVRRLARTSTVMNFGLLAGGPLSIVDVMVKPVADSAAQVRELIAQAEADGVDMEALRVQINQPISDELAGIFADLVEMEIPDSPEGLL